ncbi:MAG: hypothetical protein WC389_16835 [Lutibacter sp.]|jgi:hypothetical protein
MKTFKIKVDGEKLLGNFQSDFASLHFTGNEAENGNRIALIMIHSDCIYVSLEKEPKEISVDRDGAIWIGECTSFENKVLWPIPDVEEETAKVATELAEVYDNFVRAV